MVYTAVAVDEPIAFGGGDDGPQGGGRKAQGHLVGAVVEVEAVVGGVVDSETLVAAFHPHPSLRAFEYLFYIIVGNGMGVPGIMPVLSELVTVIPVEPGHRTKPHKPSAILIDTRDMIIGKPGSDTKMGKQVILGLRPEPARQQTAEETKKDK